MPSITKKKTINKNGRLRLLSTNLKSGSLTRLAQALSSKVGYKVFRSAKSRPNRTEFRYGDQKNKIYQYQWFQQQGINALDFTTSKEEANAWLEEDSTVVARLLTRASEGKGIVVVEPGGQLPNAPVFTRYKKKKKEFRIHIFKEQVVHVLEKRKKVGFEGADAKVRNTANGYVFCSENVIEPQGLRELAIASSKVTQSDFKGVDIGYNEKKNELFVIEVNSCPGVEGSNVQRYIEVICAN